MPARSGAGRKQVPREVHEARGTLKPRHGKTPLPVSRERPPVPPGLTATVKRVWAAIVADLETLGILAHSDAYVVEVAAVMLGRARELRVPQAAAKRAKNWDLYVKLCKLEADHLNRGKQAAEQLGLSPSARQRLGMQVSRAQGTAPAASPGKGPAGPSNVVQFAPSPRNAAPPA